MYNHIVGKDGNRVLKEFGITFWDVNSLSQTKLLAMITSDEQKAVLKTHVKELKAKVKEYCTQANATDNGDVKALVDMGIDTDSAKLLTVMGCTVDSIARTDASDLAPLYKGGVAQSENVQLFIAATRSNPESSSGGWGGTFLPTPPAKMSERVRRAMESKNG